ncbi:MAG: alpha/beta hydrolase fold domain-containing protein [Oscillospiraceae bacterium]
MKHDHKLSDQFLNSGYRKFFDLAYGTASADQKLDLWLPDAPASGPYPVVLFFHGGAFRGGAKREDQSEPVLRMLEHGYAVADVDYRKSGEAIYPAMLRDAKAAVRFLRAHAAQYDLDGARFAAWGASCGGWIVSMLGVTAGRPEFEEEGQTNPEQSDAVQAVVDWCGPCGNFMLMDPDFEQSGLGEPNHTPADSPEGQFMGGCLTELPELCRQAAPGTYVHAGVPPFLIVHGKLDQVVPVQQSRRFYGELVAAAGEGCAELHELEGVYHHGKPWNDDPVIARLTLDFLNRVLKG